MLQIRATFHRTLRPAGRSCLAGDRRRSRPPDRRSRHVSGPSASRPLGLRSHDECRIRPEGSHILRSTSTAAASGLTYESKSPQGGGVRGLTTDSASCGTRTRGHAEAGVRNPC